MSSAENHPRIDIDQVILDFQATQVKFTKLHDIPEANVSKKSQDLLDKILADPKFGDFRHTGKQSIGFNAFKEASTIFKQAFERTQNSRVNH
jgi:hypothetical protein